MDGAASAPMRTVTNAEQCMALSECGHVVTNPLTCIPSPACRCLLPSIRCRADTEQLPSPEVRKSPTTAAIHRCTGGSGDWRHLGGCCQVWGVGLPVPSCRARLDICGACPPLMAAYIVCPGLLPRLNGRLATPLLPVYAGQVWRSRVACLHQRHVGCCCLLHGAGAWPCQLCAAAHAAGPGRVWRPAWHLVSLTLHPHQAHAKATGSRLKHGLQPQNSLIVCTWHQVAGPQCWTKTEKQHEM